MPTAAQEGLRPGLQFLEQGELIRLERAPFTSPWLGPTEIPIHPILMFGRPVIFTPEFAEEVLDALPKAILEDDAVLGERFGGKGALKLRDSGIEFKGRVVDLRSRIRMSVNPDLFLVDVVPEVNGAHIRLDKRGRISPGLFSGSHHPMPIEKQIQYRPIKGSPYMIGWLRNNTANVGLVESLALRNIAILVNNLGLQKVGAV